MAKFYTRIELHNAVSKDYEVLHEAMTKAGFRTYVVSDENLKYILPPAQYYGEAQLDVAAVRGYAEQAAANTGKSFAVLVVESNAAAWSGLTVI